ncbi:MAG TPA: MBL fold metallo-hydrolase [Acidobacteriota bacterium]|jgi:phosphoribosyl 1,2-cyclic phosphodiesterase|nr:MBL fold metallo-hydrolase [Acidobacteriota bacterium]
MGVAVNILGSGSSGNAVLISSSRSRLLFDIGFSKTETLNRLGQVDIAPETIDAIFVSHEHADHVSGLRNFCKEFPRPVFMTEGTRQAARVRDSIAPLQTLRPGLSTEFQDFVVRPIPVSHDAAEPVAFTVVVEGIKIALLVDLGELTPAICREIRDSHCLILESNHDVEMLRVGPYPWIIKQRVMSAQGHLSNSATGNFLACQYDGNAEYVVLAHISQVNNHPDIARNSADQALRSRPKRSLFGSQLRMAYQDRPAETLHF